VYHKEKVWLEISLTIREVGERGRGGSSTETCCGG
jgi:hypothetical protein